MWILGGGVTRREARVSRRMRCTCRFLAALVALGLGCEMHGENGARPAGVDAGWSAVERGDLREARISFEVVLAAAEARADAWQRAEALRGLARVAGSSEGSRTLRDAAELAEKAAGVAAEEVGWTSSAMIPFLEDVVLLKRGLGAHEEALVACRRRVEMRPGSEQEDPPESWSWRALCGWILVDLDRDVEAANEFELAAAAALRPGVESMPSTDLASWGDIIEWYSDAHIPRQHPNLAAIRDALSAVPRTSDG